MKPATGTAPAKLILLGEHSVVYGQPAIAVPIERLCAKATVSSAPAGEAVSVSLDDLDFKWSLGEPRRSDETELFATLLERATADGAVPDKGWALKVGSGIPVGCGMGSSAAVSAASFKAIFEAFGIDCTPEQLSAHVYETERILHGTPSGIDNTVVAMGQPILFRRGAEIGFLATPASRAYLVVGYTGIRHKTREVVGDVRKAHDADPATYDALFDEIGRGTLEGKKAFENADWAALGQCMNRNQTLLEKMGVSSPELENLVAAARKVGALGAKLSGAGRGGCMLALSPDIEQAQQVQTALEKAGAKISICTSLPSEEAQA